MSECVLITIFVNELTQQKNGLKLTMKIACYFNGKSAFGGAERRMGRIMNLISQEGIEVVFVFRLFEPLPQVVEAYKKAIGDNFQLKFAGFNSSLDVYKYTKRERFDVVFYAGAYRYMLPFFLAAKRGNSKTILLQVTTGPSIGQFSTFVERMEFELVANNSDRIDCLYPSTTDLIKRKYRKQIVTTTPCPSTDLERFQPMKKRKRISFISRWVPGKNVELFLASVISIENQLFEKGYEVFLCGKSQDGVIESEVQNLLSAAKHPEIVICPGYIDSHDILPESEVFMSLQHINNYPSQSLIEAIACGCYIIASDEGDTRLLVKEDFGACCELNIESISRCILDYIYKDDNQKQTIPDSARKFALESFDIQKSVEHYLRLITED